MKANEFIQQLLGCAEKRSDVDIGLLPLKYPDSNFYWFPRLTSIGLDKWESNRVLLIRACIHGKEIAGPITLLNHFGEIFDYARQRKVRLVVYPLGNPSGFEMGTRYSIEDSGKENFGGNDDFLRYRMKDGSLVDDLGGGNEFDEWYWSSDTQLKLNLPKETLLMHRCFAKEIKMAGYFLLRWGVLDLHQDFITKNVGPLAYHYAFGDLSVYKKIVDELRTFIPVGPIKTAAGFSNGVAIQSDENGFIVRHDGTLTDLADRLGIKYNVTVETTGCTPIVIATKVNLIWIKGFIDLIADNH